MSEPIEFEITSTRTAILYAHWCDGKEQERRLTPAEFDVVARKMGYAKTNLTRLLTEISEQAAYEGEEWLDTLRRIIAERDEYKTKYEATFENIKKHLETVEWNNTITLDGVTYRGNEETIGKMRELAEARKHFEHLHDLACAGHTAAMKDIDDLKRQLAEAKESLAKSNEELQTLGLLHANQATEIASQRARIVELKQSSPPIPDKWRKAIEGLNPQSWTANSPFEERLAYAVRELGNAGVNVGDILFHVRQATEELLWLAAELEKAPSNA